MSWSEIKKAVNSDPSVSLDKKIEYVGGVIPRGMEKITQSVGNTGSAKRDLVNIDGNGLLLYCKYVFKGTYFGMPGTMYIDEGMSTEKVVNFTGDSTDNGLSVDMQQIASSKFASGMNVSGRILLNYPIFFHKLRFNGCTGTNDGSFVLQYVLLD